MLNFRTYDVKTGRFFSVDPLYESMPGYTPYHYSFNNPVRFKDGSGLLPEKEKGDRIQVYLCDWQAIQQALEHIANDEGNYDNQTRFIWLIECKIMEIESAIFKILNAIADIGGSGSSGGSGTQSPPDPNSTAPNRTGDNNQSDNGQKSEGKRIHITFMGIDLWIDYDEQKAKDAGISEEMIANKVKEALMNQMNYCLEGESVVTSYTDLCFNICFSAEELADFWNNQCNKVGSKNYHSSLRS